MDIIIGVVIGVVISWLFAWVVQPLLLFKDKATVDTRLAQIERYLAKADRRLKTLETTTQSQMMALQSSAGANVLIEGTLQTQKKGIHGFRFQQIMGVVFILKPFIPLILLATLGLIGYQMVSDIQNDPVIMENVTEIQNKVAFVQQEVKTIEAKLDGLKQDLSGIKTVIDAIASIFRDIQAFINDHIIKTLDDLWLLGTIPRLDLGIPGIGNITESIGALTDIAKEIGEIGERISPILTSLGNLLAKWWGYLQFFGIFTVVLVGLSIFSNAYWNIRRGFALLRGADNGINANRI